MKLPEALMIDPRTPDVFASAMKKKKYCPTVCTSDRVRTFFQDSRFGTRNFLAKTEPKTIVIAPAIMNRAPASMILEAVSSGVILNSS